MDQDQRQLEQRIERTRAGLGDDIDALADKVSPTRIVGRRMDRAKESLGGVRDTMMGTAQSATEAIGDSASSSTTALRRQAQGNPLAVGVMAFGLGWLVSSLLPVSDTESNYVGSMGQALEDKVAPVVDQMKDAALEVADNLREPAAEAVQGVRETAQEAASTVRSESSSAAGR